MVTLHSGDSDLNPAPSPNMLATYQVKEQMPAGAEAAQVVRCDGGGLDSPSDDLDGKRELLAKVVAAGLRCDDAAVDETLLLVRSIDGRRLLTFLA